MKAVFFDKDGTLIKNVPYNVNPDLIEMTAGAAQAVQDLRAADFKLFVISNQSGVARGFFAAQDLGLVWRKLDELFGVQFDGFYFCPHFEKGTIPEYMLACDCRKPSPGLILQAAREHGINLKKSWMIGDNISDAEAGRDAGCQTILLVHDNKISDSAVALQQTAANLTEAANLILRSK